MNKTIKSIILCIRFPFLYPRNRFTGLHYNNYKLQNLIEKLNKGHIQDIWFDTTTVDDKPYASTLVKDGDIYSIKIVNGKIQITRNLKIVLEEPFSFFGEGLIKRVYATNKNFIFVVSEDFELNKRVIIIKNHTFKTFLAYILRFIYNYPLQWIHCVPTFTELDSMPDGWRKAFGIQMCKEIKQALKEINYLRKYRIMQIKEKYGSLRWYDAGNNIEIQNIIDKYERISAKTCINCGKPAKYISRGWISPYCENCIDKNFEYDRI